MAGDEAFWLADVGVAKPEQLVETAGPAAEESYLPAGDLAEAQVPQVGLAHAHGEEARPMQAHAGPCRPLSLTWLAPTTTLG